MEDVRTRLAAAGKGANTITNVTGILRRVLDDLVVDRQLAYNPAALPNRGKRPGKAPRTILVPMHEEVDRLLAAASEEARPVLELAASLGLRRAELLALTSEDVDFDAREVVVRTSKTEAGERIVSMFGSARRVLLSRRPAPASSAAGSRLPHHRRHGGASGRMGASRVPTRLRTGRTAGHAPPLRPVPLRRLPPDRARRERPPRLQGGRHSKASVTLDVYSHLFKEGLAEAAERFDPLGRDVRLRGVVDER